jgi:hypothetical protein
MPKEASNPEVCLFHTTSDDRLAQIFKNGLDPYSVKTCEKGVYDAAEEEGITDEEEISNWLSECQVPSVHARTELDSVLNREESVYFIKDERYKIFSPKHDNVLEVPAELIPCKCIEDNYELENTLYDWIYANYSDFSSSSPEEEIWKATDDVLATQRPLDDKFNKYTTEVLCPCPIPAKIIRHFKVDSIGSCKIESKRRGK